ncbi:hypothetical protein [Mesorhizobium sp. M4A.F.Ca.ET.022.05.2.1]|uniref:hypothetical protein n=1 Tax=Mesorhizobium sp. M4A.F.Ca.ET.022.05.2.1 TaxID=2496653 RepID=UPI001FE11516|nr:hypothetical protein [Mesorhizobium sp. M4A.F.Ca.ET.022.05.2.1]
MKTMKEKDIPALVQAVVDIGCDIHAIGRWGYVFGDGDLTPAQQRAIAPQLRWIAETYGERDHLMDEIIAYLGRSDAMSRLSRRQVSTDGGGRIRLVSKT